MVVRFFQHLRHVDAYTNVRGKHHFRQSGEQAAITTVVVGQHIALVYQLLHHFEEAAQGDLVVHIRGNALQSFVHLGQSAAA